MYIYVILTNSILF